MVKSAQNKERTVMGLDKVDFYKWSDPGGPGELAWINKEDLHIDHTYQRDEFEARSLELAGSWWWMACGTITVAERKDRTLCVIDGQHRVMAAMKRSDIRKLPCVIFRSEGVEVEARAFIQSNRNRKVVSSADMFRARIVSADRVAIAVDKLIRESGREAKKASSPTTVACVSTLTRCAEKNIGALERIWPIACEVCQGKPMAERIVSALYYIEATMLNDSDRSLRDPVLRDRIVKIGFDEMMRAANNAAVAAGIGGAKQWAYGVVSAINKGLRVNKIPL